MRLFWKERKSGQQLVLCADDGTETEVGAVRGTPRGYDALAMTNTYDPGRAQKGLGTMEEAKAFVEEFHPWDLFGGDLEMEVELEVQHLQADPSAATAPAPVQPPAGEGAAPTGEAEPIRSASPVEATAAAEAEPIPSSSPAEPEPRKQGWQFWRRG